MRVGLSLLPCNSRKSNILSINEQLCTSTIFLWQYFWQETIGSQTQSWNFKAAVMQKRAFGSLRLRNFKRATCYVPMLPTACTNASLCAHRPPIEKIVTKQRIEGVMFVMLYDISRNWKKKNIIFPKSTGLPDLYQQHTQKQVLDIIREIYIDDNSNRN